MFFFFEQYYGRRRSFPDVIELKSFFDLASSIITYIRTKPNDTWIICEGKDDKQYLECVLYGEKNINIITSRRMWKCIQAI